LHRFDVSSDAQAPHGDLTAAPDGWLYAGYSKDLLDGTFEKGLVRVDPASGAAIKLAALASTDGLLGESGFFLGRGGVWFGGTRAPWSAYAIAMLDGVDVAAASGSPGGTTSLSATLKASGIALAGRTIDFAVNGNAVGSAETNADGVATLNEVSLSGLASGSYPIDAAFGGDEHFPAASGVASLTVVSSATPGLMWGAGFIRDHDIRYDFGFLVSERANGTDRGGFELRVTSPSSYKRQGHKVIKIKGRSDRFVARSFTNVVFSDDPAIHPERYARTETDTVLFAGIGDWNGYSGYRFEAVAQDRGGRRRESLRVTVYDSANAVVVEFDGELSDGNVQSVRVRR
jgi:hypothetical protein